MASRSSAPMSLQNGEIFSNLLRFEVFVSSGLELKGKMLEILKRRLGDERLKCSINRLKAVLKINVDTIYVSIRSSLLLYLVTYLHRKVKNLFH